MNFPAAHRSSCLFRKLQRRYLLLALVLTLAVAAITGCGGSSGGGTTVTPLSIATTSLANGTAGTAYTATLSASGGTAPYSWSLTAGHLPAGLALNGMSGSITGTPSTPVAATALTFTVSDSGSPAQSKSVSLTLTIAPASLVITTSSLPGGTVGVAYSTTLATTGGTSPFTWSLNSGTLPTGLSLNPSTGAITGNPSVTANNLALTFSVTDSGTPAQTKTVNLTLTIVPAPLVITTASLPSGTVGVAYSTTLAATGGTTPFTWSLTSGTLPTGLSLTPSTGAIAGTPSVSATNAALTFKVTDSGTPAQSKTVNLTLTIVPVPLAITTVSLPSGTVGVAYSTALAATGGTTPFSWSLTSGTLPAGLSLTPSTGAIAGTPSATATNAALTFSVTDSGTPAQTKTVNLTLTIVPAPLVITTTSLPSGTVGVAYSAALAATGGTTPFTWSLTSGTLPTGLSLNPSTGAITGTPSVAATNLALTFSVTDSGTPAQTKTVNLTLTIAPATLVITTTSLPNGTVDSPYSATLAVTGGTSPFTWSLTSGTLPTGLTLNPATGAISGSPSASVTSAALTFKVTDSGAPAQNASVNLTLTVVAAPLVITTTSLPGGTVGVAYSTTLATTGGTTPLTWSLTSGTLPTGLSLNPATGAITGTPSAVVTNAALNFKVTDSGSPAQSQSVSLTLTIAAPPLVITTSSLPNGTVGIAYSATLAATGGTTPFTWSLTSGTLPTGLSLNPSTGAITGTTSVAATNTPLTFTLTDSSAPVQTQKVNLTLSIFSLLVSPVRASLVIDQALPVSATTNDSAGVTWSATGSGCSGSACGAFSSTTSKSGVPVTYTAPASAGVYTITATGVTNPADTFSSTVAVTDLAAVATYHANQYRDGANTQEYALTPSTVTTATFGKLASCPVDGAIYAQPLWVPNLTIASAVHNVVIVATMHDSIYAFDADSTGTCTLLWQVSLVDTAHGAAAGEIAVPSDGDISPEFGITGTPVIDLTTNTLYAVASSKLLSPKTFIQRIHAISLLNGSEKFSGPTTIAATYPGTGDNGTTTTFSAKQENQRAGLVLANGVVYISWASHEDQRPYYGWMIGYKAADLTQAGVLNIDPNSSQGGIWMSGGAPAVDSSNNLYVLTANGEFDAANATPPTNDYGDSFLQITPDLKVAQYFTPSNELADQDNDADFGSGGAVLFDIPANGTHPTHLAIGGGKDGNFVLLNRDDLGGSGNAYAWQRFSLGNSIFATGAYWNDNFYVAGWGGPLKMFTFNPATAMMNTPATSVSTATFGFPGATPSVSSNPAFANGIVWALNNSQYCTEQSHGCGPAVLHAYSAADLKDELWNSSQAAGDAAGNAVKFVVPTVANGKVYVGTRGNNLGDDDSTTSTPGELDVYGLLPN